MKKQPLKTTIQSFIKNNYKNLIFYIILFGINLSAILLLLPELGKKKTALVGLLLIASLIITSLTFYLKIKKKLPTHRVFLFIAPIIGLLYLFLIPLTTPPDEPNHFRRAYEISEGFIVSDRSESGVGGRVLPDSITTAMTEPASYSEIPTIIAKSSSITSESFQNFGNTSLYSPFSYLPEVVGIWLGRILHLPMFFIVYLGRIFNFLAYYLLIYYALKRIPSGKSVLLLLALSPIAMQAAISCQADALINGSVFALSALVFHKIKHPTSLTKSEKFILSGLTFLIAMCKIVYLPICFLICLLPRSCFKSKKDKTIKVTAILAISILANLLWLALSSGYLIEFTPGVNSKEQVVYILTHPFRYLLIIINSFFTKGTFYYYSGLSASLGRLNINIPEIIIVFFGLFLLYTRLSEKRNTLSFTKFQKIFISLTLLACVLLICTSLYVQWTSVGNQVIEGIQGRYFLPFLPIAFLLLRPLSSRTNPLKDLAPFIFIIFLNIYALTAIMSHYMV